MNKCVLPFIRYDHRVKSPCCLLSTEYKHQKHYQNLLDDHRNNRQSNFCGECWKVEKNGGKSKRQKANQNFKKYLHVNEPQIKSLVIPTGNVCNLQCVTCGLHSSSSWKPKFEFMKKNNNLFNKKNQNVFNLIPRQFENINWKYIEDIEFLGGETLMSKNLWHFLDIIKDDTVISLLTNGTIILKDWQIAQLKKKSKLHICFSLDGTGKIFEFLRQPAKWDHIYENILQYKKHFGNDRLSFNVTVSNINIFYIDEIFKNLIKILPSKSNITFVENPIEFSYTNLTKEQGKILELKNPYFFKNKNVNWTATQSSFEKFVKNIKLQEQFSKKYIKDYLPEYYELIKEQYLRH